MTFSIWCCNYAVFALCITVASQYTLEELGIHNAQTEIGLNITEILNDIFSHGYDKRVRPNYAGPPVEVGVSMYIISISSVSEVQMDFTADFYFRQAWRDPRLAFEPRPSIDALFVGAEIADKIWNPDTFFANEKSAQFHIATTPNTFIRLTSMGDVLRSTRLTVTSSCAMNLQYFPMDKQLCTIEVESYGYSMADIMYKWGKGKDSVGMSTEVQLPQFKVQGLQQKSKVEVLVTGNYSRLVCELEFVRSMGYYLIQIYIPASLIVIISWVSFWLHRNASPARVQLGVMTVLTMTTLMSSTNAALPKISYVKSIDVFLGTCFVMVFATLLEYATVGYLGKRIAMRKRQQSQQASAIAKANRTLQRTEIENENGAAQQAIGFARENIYAQRNAAADIRYRLIGMNTTTEGTSQQQQQQDPARQAVVNKIQRSIDLTKKRISFVESSSNAEEGESPEGSAPGPAFHGNKNKNTLFGIEPSDIDKYSRVVFPVCFLCFNLMYWIIYMHISEFLAEFENVE